MQHKHGDKKQNITFRSCKKIKYALCCLRGIWDDLFVVKSHLIGQSALTSNQHFGNNENLDFYDDRYCEMILYIFICEIC